MTIYQRKLKQQIKELHPDIDSSQLLDLLFKMGVVDHTRCKVLAIRRWVEEAVRQGSRKVDAMYQAAEEFACSYEYVRKCMYYYKEVNLA